MIVLTIVILAFVSSVSSIPVFPGLGGLDDDLGTWCAVCNFPSFSPLGTIGIGAVEKTAELRNQTIVEYLDAFCDAFDRKPSTKKWVKPCKDMVDFLGPIIIEMLTIGLGPDDICLSIDVCHNKECRLYPGPVPPELKEYIDTLSMETQAKLMAENKFDPFGWIKQLLKELESQEPIDDADHDLHSPEPELRGWHWRGIDSDDQDPRVRPGYSSDFETSTFPNGAVDANNNGVFGRDPTSGQLYEDLYCKDSQARGIMVLGDSATAGFGLKLQAVMAPEQFVDFLLDEGDYPQCSWDTGDFDSGENQCLPTPGLIQQSVYSTMVKKNRCNKNDYINLSVNGMRSSHLKTAIYNYNTSRIAGTDKPLLVFLGMTGDDVCNPHPGMSHMTTPSEFRSNIQIVLDELDNFVPPNSHVVFYGMEYGLEMWNYEWNRTHPTLGLEYGHIWRYMDCIIANACTGWLTSNKTLRLATQQRADELNDVFADMATHPPKTYKNFDLYNFPNPSKEIEYAWINKGLDPMELRCKYAGGGHPSQYFHMFTSQKILSDPHIQTILGPVNPHNAAIDKLGARMETKGHK